VLNQSGDLVPEFELVKDLLDVGRKPVKIRFKICFQLVLFCPRLQIAESERGDIVKCLSGFLAKCSFLVCNFCRIKRFLHLQDCGFGWLQNRIDPPDNDHWQDYITVFSPDIIVPQNIIGNSPNKILNPCRVPVTHTAPHSR